MRIPLPSYPSALLRRQPVRVTFAGLVVLVAIVAPGAAQWHVLQSPDPLGLALLETNSGVRIENAEGSPVPVAPPPGTVFSDFRELSGGWIAAGHRLTDTGHELVLLNRHGDSIERLDPPPGDKGALRLAPVLLIDAGRLEGLAWLEGDGGENNAVRSASWNGSEWEEIATVSPWTGEAQLALSAAVLDDGSSLLVWAAVVGEDDEILWSRFVGSSWSPPQRMHSDNEVPDVSPAIAPVTGGAIAAWSQFDGRDYRLRIARFADGAWSELDAVSTSSDGRGATHPIPFHRLEGAGFLYRTAVPRTWSLIEIAAAGSSTRRTSMRRLAGESRPLVFAKPDVPNTIRLRFADDEAIASGASAVESHTWYPLDWKPQP